MAESDRIFGLFISLRYVWLARLAFFHRLPMRLLQFTCVFVPVALAAFLSNPLASAVGTWQAITAPCPNYSGGGLMLLSDGTVLCKSSAGAADGYGNIWNRLIPNIAGSYVGGSWSAIAPMNDTRLYFSSQLLRDGRLYVAGAEYGTGKATGEVYDPLTNLWTPTASPGANISDANSEILADGRILQARVATTLKSNVIFNPITNTYATGASCIGIHNESVWVKLRDGSILMVDRNSTASERYRQTTGTWVADSTVPVELYTPFGSETGGAVLLPDGRAFFAGSIGKTAIYTPGVAGANGTWIAGADIPSSQAAPDAPMAMMANGKVLCAFSLVPTTNDHFPSPTSFYEYDPVANAFTQIGAPAGGTSSNDPVFIFTFIDLPDGKILCAKQGSRSFWIYTPDGVPVVGAAPIISSVIRGSTGVFTLTGQQLNGISEGASYGDDWQMNTNYPVVRLERTGGVYYARTFDWSSTGVQTGALVTTTRMTVPSNVPFGSYNLRVTANGIASLPWTFWNPNPSCLADVNLDGRVDGADLAIVLGSWGTSGNFGGADINGDGTIDGFDLGSLLASWGVCPTGP